MGDFMKRNKSHESGMSWTSGLKFLELVRGVLTIDSSVATSLHEESYVLGVRFSENLVDGGVMRFNECQQGEETLGQHLGINLTVMNAADLFLDCLRGITEPEPEEERKMIGSTLFEKEAEKHTQRG